MTDKSITERQQYWLEHLKSAQDTGSSLGEYAKANDLKVKDLYQWKTSLVKRGFLVSPGSAFVAVKTKSSSAACSLVLPNGIRLEFQGSLSPELVKAMVTSASALL